jgi:hypothetical protein
MLVGPEAVRLRGKEVPGKAELKKEQWLEQWY